MFETNFQKVFLDDFVVYFLANELELQQLIGIDVDFNTMNKELKNEVKQECYDFMLKNEIISMDFGGNTVVEDKYKELIKAFEYPEYCCIVQTVDNENDQSGQRKIYSSNNAYIGLDYVDESSSAVYKFDNEQDANSFAFLDLNIYSNQIDDHMNGIAISDLEKEINSAKKCVIVTEYIMAQDSYESLQKVYILKDDWYEAETDENEQIVLCKVLYPVSI